MIVSINALVIGGLVVFVVGLFFGALAVVTYLLMEGTKYG